MLEVRMAKKPTESSGWRVPSDEAIAAILSQRIDVERQGVGIVVGVIDANGRRIISHGVRKAGGGDPVDAETVFEIGSISKVFTSLVLSDMVRNGEVALDDPVAKFLPPGVTMPERGGRQITLIDLATHTSGIPRMPDNFAPADPANPYIDYGADRLHAFVSGHVLTCDIGETYEYSNVGVGLLGHVLALRAGQDFESLVRDRITGPLGMNSTAMTLTPAMKRRLAAGHDANMKPVANWDLGVLAGAGGLRSTTDDLLTFLAAELGFKETGLKDAMADQIVPRRATGLANSEVALGWHVRAHKHGHSIWHNGGTGGYRTFMAFEPTAKVGVVVLTNASTERGGDDIGGHLLLGGPLAPPPIVRTAISLAPEVLEKYVGRYEFAGGRSLIITRDGAHLFAEVEGYYEIFPETETDFFWKVVNAQVSFKVGRSGRVTGAVTHRGGVDTPAKRVKGGG
jgi:D-alanyl-D-alanine-carboxypeptidase/D-alanyl-D-alanine-endopeptidase